MKIGIVGYGRMGKAVENAINCKNKENGLNLIEVPLIVDPIAEGANAKSVDDVKNNKIDCVIDFSHPSCAISNIEYYIKNDIKAIIGTTGWYDKIPNLKLKNTTSILYSGNFSIGVALFLKISEYASSLFDKFTNYDAAITEFHHNQKADSPSGTASMLADKVMGKLNRKSELVIGNSEGKIKPNELQISSVRLGSVFGRHSLYFDSDVDTITIEHNAKSRDGFAKGAVNCALWLCSSCKTGLLTLDDYLKNVFNDV